MKYSFFLARDTDITPEQFERICDNVNVSRNLFSQFGDDYFEAGISPFKGSTTCFQIDASKVNDKEILVFVISAKNRSSELYLFGIKQDFEGDLNAYRTTVIEKILKVKKYGIVIVGLTTDNLPVQIKALFHESEELIQNKYPELQQIIHFRCVSHLLNMAYKDWIKSNNVLSKYENKIRNIMKVLSLKPFIRKLSKKSPKFLLLE